MIRKREFTAGVALLALCFTAGACGAGRTKPAPPAKVGSEKAPALLEAAGRAMAQGDYKEALRLSEAASREKQPGARLLHLRVLFLTGQFDEVARLGGAAGNEGKLLVAKSHRARGRLKEAEVALADIETKPSDLLAFRVTLEKGEILLELGSREEANAQLLSLVEQANEVQGPFTSIEKRPEAWAIVGRAAHLLRSPEDANDAFNESEKLSQAQLSLLLWRSELYLEKFDVAHATEVQEEAEKLSPHHPEVLLRRAQILFEETHSFSQAEEAAKAVLAIDPGNTGALAVLAGVALRDLDFETALGFLERGLLTNPRDLKLLSIQAAVRFLSEDEAGYQAEVEHIHALSPGYTEVFRVVADYAEWEHRYPDIETMMRKAVRMDPEDGRARATLGLTLVRSASDAAGVVELRRSFELDPFNVRVLNTLDLYEKTIPKDYLHVRRGPFEFRFPRAEAPLLKRYVPQLVQEAFTEMSARYGYQPDVPIMIEIYEAKEQFAVRTSGLPRTAIHGVCFGNKLATMSPVAAPGNLGMTLWHELAHVFHLGLSKNRVPRWLTEGLAEWETAQRKVGWSREMDLNLARALREDTLPELGSMNRAFTHARRMEDVATAYYASSKLAEWIVDSRGEKTAVSILAELGEKKLAREVIPKELGATFSELDREFRAAEQEKLKRFSEQTLSPDETRSSVEIKKLLKLSPADRKLKIALGLAHLSEGDAKAAHAILSEVLRSGFEVDAALGESQALLFLGNKKEAIALLQKLIEQKHDGYEIRMKLARLMEADGNDDAALAHLLVASEQDPLSAETLGMLASQYRKRGDRAKELEVVAQWASLSEHDPLVHQQLLVMLLEAEKFKEAAEAAKLAIWVDLANMDNHRLAGLAFARSGDLKAAEFEWESALLCPGGLPERGRLEETWRGELARRGLKKQEREVMKRFAELPLPSAGSPPLSEGVPPPSAGSPPSSE